MRFLLVRYVPVFALAFCFLIGGATESVAQKKFVKPKGLKNTLIKKGKDVTKMSSKKAKKADKKSSKSKKKKKTFKLNKKKVGAHAKGLKDKKKLLKANLLPKNWQHKGSNKGAGQDAKKKARLPFHLLKLGLNKDQKWINSYLLAGLSKLAYYPKKKGYGDHTHKNKKKNAKNERLGGKVNAKRFKNLGLKLCDKNANYWARSTGRWNKVDMDAQAYVLHNDSVVVVVFRGTKEGTDGFTDGATLKYGVKGYSNDILFHEGFLEAAIHAEVNLKLARMALDCRKKGGKNRAIIVTGHSLGGAMAAVWTFLTRYKSKEPIATRLYTYGSPRVGTSGFVSAYNKLKKGNGLTALRSVRWIRRQDAVTFVPTESMGFRGVGAMHWMKGVAKKGSTNNSGLKLITKITGRMGRVAPSLPSVGDHDCVGYTDDIYKIMPTSARNKLKQVNGRKLVQDLLTIY